jgi:hypothetical protein
MLIATIDHLLQNVLPAAKDYEVSEEELSLAYNVNQSPDTWAVAAADAKRKAAQLAIAIDGLSDRARHDLSLDLGQVRKAVSALSYWPGSAMLRAGAFERVRGVANAYKHRFLSDTSLPLSSDNDILVIELGYGLDGWGVGKFGGVEVLVRDESGAAWKFLGDAPAVVSAWFQYLTANGGIVHGGPYQVCGFQVYP